MAATCPPRPAPIGIRSSSLFVSIADSQTPNGTVFMPVRGFNWSAKPSIPCSAGCPRKLRTGFTLLSSRSIQMNTCCASFGAPGLASPRRLCLPPLAMSAHSIAVCELDMLLGLWPWMPGLRFPRLLCCSFTLRGGPRFRLLTALLMDELMSLYASGLP